MKHRAQAPFINLGRHQFETTARFQRIVYPAVRYDGESHLTSPFESRAMDVLFADRKVPRLEAVEVCTLDYLDIPQFLRRAP